MDKPTLTVVGNASAKNQPAGNRVAEFEKICDNLVSAECLTTVLYDLVDLKENEDEAAYAGMRRQLGVIREKLNSAFERICALEAAERKATTT